ncbi:MAG: M2 family metallopeptidase [Porticoccaceae bacterium]|nr:M2 family metallopeptidase [Porticoccaceae bacterium]MDG1473840.1 M2 family metallopeptidase [Porticoccaceae bacterium]
MKATYLSILVLVLTASACAERPFEQPAATETAKQFVQRIQEEGAVLDKEISAAYWVRSTYITPDTAILASKAGERGLSFASRMVKQAKQYRDSPMDQDTARAIELMLRGSAAPAPDDANLRAELSSILTDMEGQYGAGKYCSDNGHCMELQELESVLAQSRDYDELLDVWQGWRQVSPSYRKQYQRFVEIVNQGAKDFGYKNLADLWQGGYDMESEVFVEESRRLWGQVKPFYEELHCYVRGQLSETYGADKVPLNQPIPAHLLGNMWSQTWDNIYDIAEPYSGVASLDVTKALVEQGYDELRMTKTAEAFFTSLGLPSLPESFYTNSMIKKPRDRSVVCHASAWDIDNGNDPRIKQCVEINEEQLETLHHELGHIYYYIMYKDQPSVFKGGAHDGFHEAIGDTIQLSMTPSYLKQKGLIAETVDSDQATINKQMKMALQKIAFLPFGKMIDEWRWQVFSGEILPEDYNAGWWRLREQYQGIAAPIERSEADFDAGAKYHIPGNTPYTRYFLSFIMQFQFHKALCDAAGYEGPLHECSIYGNKVAGKKLGDLLAMGQSKPWPDAMEAMTGQRDMDGSAIIDYFAPLNAWLKIENEGQQCGW